jgi:hypothetical protein
MKEVEIADAAEDAVSYPQKHAFQHNSPRLAVARQPQVPQIANCRPKSVGLNQEAWNDHPASVGHW